ncbi:four helix bundle protein [Dysgonomonas sp. Marseille-Q5470]|uniref:four helix bundle protein n=1 Tax=Dysgonomonas sp. Marseille-Q5470 TaxID=3039494 RepID=UPI0024BCFEB8|nr:four helix bundle protein [Dysgonomonas sp. Marseille-Q5470]MBS5979543.1 four helix bundle protein [Dysgonomonas mossii]
MITNSLVYEKAYSFAIRIVNAYKFLKDKQEFVLSKQLLKAGTSVGANIAEANGAISDSDFSAKISIAYKEILETKYWLSLLKDTGYISSDTFNDVHEDADEIAKMLYSILKITRINKI